jgi:hypothetical protein
VCRNIRLNEAKSIHEGDNSVRCGLKTRIQSKDTVGLTHIEQINGVNCRIPREEGYISPPVTRRTDQSMEKEQRQTGTRALVVYAHTARSHKRVFDQIRPQ